MFDTVHYGMFPANKNFALDSFLIFSKERTQAFALSLQRGSAKKTILLLADSLLFVSCALWFY